MTWTFQNLISSQNHQHVELKKLPNKKYFVHKNIWRINYFITSMFLQKLHTYNWNPNRASQKFSAGMTKLCAVTKLGDLTVHTPVKEHNEKRKIQNDSAT
jgi:hypothetical protein